MSRITRRHFIAASSVALGASRAAAAELPPNEQELYEAAKREGEVTWYSAQIQSEPAEAAGRAFTERYPGVKVNVVRSTSQVAFQRLSQDLRAGVAQCDIFSSTDYGHYLFLKREGNLLSFRPKNADGLLPALRNQDPDNAWQICSLGLYLIIYNTKKVAAADAPKSWKDVLDPKWKDQVAVGHPGYSGSIGIMCVLLRRLYGWDYFTALEKNKPQIGRSSDDPVTLLNAGERNVGIGVTLDSTLLSMARGNPLAFVYPTEGSEVVYGPSAIPKTAPHPNAAKLFMEFATGPMFGQALRKYYVMPVRPDVPPPEGALPVDKVKLLSATPQEIETGVPEVKEQWRDTFGV
ncbi:MAG TPA: extracellular solute-binding protein [Acetobacteraceae bacterium]|jgi:iron(III) transport system substrate-binding protein|nr:extracellular solute-binding protein [Acetobacteraceae bacterium]